MINSRVLWILIGVSIFFILLNVKLFDLQILKNEESIFFAKRQQNKTEFIKAERGLIYDRNNVLLVYNRNDISFYLDNKYVTTKDQLNVAKKLAENNVFIGLIDVYILKPFNEDFFFEKIKNYSQIVTIEEAFINKGGLDGLISKILNNKNSGIRLKRMGFQDAYVFDIGSREYLHKLNNLDEESINKIIKELVKEYYK